MSGFADVYQRLCERYPDEKVRGLAFEPVVKRVLTTDPIYQQRFSRVWHWNEWPGRDGGDIGVDIIAERHDGRLVAIQCKCQDHIEKSNINSFLADSQRRLLGEPYAERYIFHDGDKRGATMQSGRSPALTLQYNALISSTSNHPQ